MGDQGGQKRKIGLTTCVDRIEKSIIVVEFASSRDRLRRFTTAEETRDCKNLAKQAAEAWGAELGPKINLPFFKLEFGRGGRGRGGKGRR